MSVDCALFDDTAWITLAGNVGDTFRFVIDTDVIGDTARTRATTVDYGDGRTDLRLQVSIKSFEIAEPGTLAIMGLGLMGLGVARRLIAS